MPHQIGDIKKKLNCFFLNLKLFYICIVGAKKEKLVTLCRIQIFSNAFLSSLIGCTDFLEVFYRTLIEQSALFKIITIHHSIVGHSKFYNLSILVNIVRNTNIVHKRQILVEENSNENISFPIKITTL